MATQLQPLKAEFGSVVEDCRGLIKEKADQVKANHRTKKNRLGGAPEIAPQAQPPHVATKR